MALNTEVTQQPGKQVSRQPQGVYTSLNDLQQLRYIAGSFIQTNKLSKATHSGQHKSRALSRGMEFEEVRVYQPGDDVRNIDWRVTARTQQTHTKCYRDEKEIPVITLVDQRRSLFFGSQHCFKSVYACQLAALINWSTLKRNDRVGGLVLGTNEISEIRPARSQATVNRWLHKLTLANNTISPNSQHKEPSLMQALEHFKRIATSGTECIVISDFYDIDAHSEKYLYQLSRHHPVTLFWLVDPLEKTLPLMPSLTISNGVNKRVITINKKNQKQQLARYDNKRDYLHNIAHRYKLKFVEIDIQYPFHHYKHALFKV